MVKVMRHQQRWRQWAASNMSTVEVEATSTTVKVWEGINGVNGRVISGEGVNCIIHCSAELDGEKITAMFLSVRVAAMSCNEGSR